MCIMFFQYPPFRFLICYFIYFYHSYKVISKADTFSLGCTIGWIKAESSRWRYVSLFTCFDLKSSSKIVLSLYVNSSIPMSLESSIQFRIIESSRSAVSLNRETPQVVRMSFWNSMRSGETIAVDFLVFFTSLRKMSLSLSCPQYIQLS